MASVDVEADVRDSEIEAETALVVSSPKTSARSSEPSRLVARIHDSRHSPPCERKTPRLIPLQARLHTQPMSWSTTFAKPWLSSRRRDTFRSLLSVTQLAAAELQGPATLRSCSTTAVFREFQGESNTGARNQRTPMLPNVTADSGVSPTGTSRWKGANSGRLPGLRRTSSSDPQLGWQRVVWVAMPGLSIDQDSRLKCD